MKKRVKRRAVLRNPLIDTEPTIDDTDPQRGVTAAAKTIGPLGRRIAERLERQDHELVEGRLPADYPITSRTSTYTLGKLKTRKDALGMRARQELGRREQTKSRRLRPAGARDVIRRHIVGGRLRPKTSDLEAASEVLKKIKPRTIARTINKAVAERKKQETAKAYRSKVKREVRREVEQEYQDKLAGEVSKVRDQFKRKLTKREQAAIVPKPSPPKDRIRGPSHRVKAELPATTFGKAPRKSKSEKAVLDKAREQLKTGVRNPATPHELQPKQPKVRHRKRPPPNPSMPLPPDRVIEKPRVIVRDHKGRNYPAKDYYMTKTGNVSAWDELEDAYDKGIMPPESEMPDEQHKDDPRYKRPTKMQLWFNKRTHHDRKRGIN